MGAYIPPLRPRGGHFPPRQLPRMNLLRMGRLRQPFPRGGGSVPVDQLAVADFPLGLPDSPALRTITLSRRCLFAGTCASKSSLSLLIAPIMVVAASLYRAGVACTGSLAYHIGRPLICRSGSESLGSSVQVLKLNTSDRSFTPCTQPITKSSSISSPLLRSGT
jgi:hypothetical protein